VNRNVIKFGLVLFISICRLSLTDFTIIFYYVKPCGLRRCSLFFKIGGRKLAEDDVVISVSTFLARGFVFFLEDDYFCVFFYHCLSYCTLLSCSHFCGCWHPLYPSSPTLPLKNETVKTLSVNSWCGCEVHKNVTKLE